MSKNQEVVTGEVVENSVVTTEEIANEIVSSVDVGGAELMTRLQNPNNNFYCSMVTDGSRSSKVKIYNAINNPTETLADNVNVTIEAVDVCAHVVTIVDEKTGEIKDCMRTVIVDKNGVGYSAVSIGVASSLEKIFAIVGKPDDEADPWTKNPVKLMPKNVGKAPKITMTLVLVP